MSIALGSALPDSPGRGLPIRGALDVLTFPKMLYLDGVAYTAKGRPVPHQNTRLVATPEEEEIAVSDGYAVAREGGVLTEGDDPEDGTDNSLARAIDYLNKPLDDNPEWTEEDFAAAKGPESLGVEEKAAFPKTKADPLDHDFNGVKGGSLPGKRRKKSTEEEKK